MKRTLLLMLMPLLSLASAMGLDIDKNLYYTISSRNNHDAYMKDTGKDVLQCNVGLDTYSYWRFIPTGNEGCYYVQNLYSKRYIQAVAESANVAVNMGTEPVEIFIMSAPSEGTDCFGMTSSDHVNLAFNSSACFAMNWHEDNKIVQSYMAAIGTNHKSFWFFREVEPPSCLIGSHEFEHGVCNICGALDLNYVEQAEDGFYKISEGYQLEWFSAMVNTGRNDLCARLMNDIDMQGIEHTPIAKNVDLRWRGTFDGQGHRIKNLVINRPTENIQGLFGYLRGNSDSNTRVCNLIIDKSCSFTAYHQVGAIAGCSQGNTGLITLENIVNEANVTAEGGTDAAALVGGQTGNAPTWRIRNIVNTGAITSTASDGYAGVIAGYYGSNAQNLQENIVNLGVVTGFNAGNQLGRLTGTFINVIDLSGTEGAEQGLDHDFTTEDVASGRLCYYLNGNQSNISFYQTLGQDDYPVPFATSLQVYMQGTLLCDGTPVGDEGTYSNSNEGSIVPPHTFASGDFYCTVCGAFNNNFVSPVDGVLHMSTPLQLQWLAGYVENGGVNLDVVMDNDIDMDGEEFAGIGSLATPFLGHFDGGYHTISNLVMAGVEHDWSGFFNFIRGGSVVENLRLDENCYITGLKGTALIGGCGMQGDVLLRNLGFEGSVSGLTTTAGAILGANYQSIAKLTVENCYSTGSVSGGAESAALIGWLGNNGAIISNSWTSATASGIQSEDKYAFRHENATITNCFSMYGTQAQRIEDGELESGSLCYRLNGDQSVIRWFQNLDNGEEEDYFPTFIPTHGTVVVQADMRCDGTYDAEEARFSNSGEVIIPPHTYVDGFCKVCGQEDESYPFIRIFANADHENAQGYINSNSNDGSGLNINNSVAEHWNQKWFDTYQELTGLEPGLYKLRVQGLSRVKTWNNNDQIAYEDADLNPDYIQLYHNSQFYAEVKGRRIGNLFMDIAEGRQEKPIGTGTQTYHEATGYYVPNSMAACRDYFSKGLYWNEPIYFVVESEQDTVKVGLENQMYLAGNWTVWDTWRLERVTGTDAAIELISAQQEKNLQELDQLEAQTQLVESYQEASETLYEIASLDEMLNVANQLSRLPEQIRLSHLAYIDYKAAVEAVRNDLEGREHLYGPDADLLYTYLNEDEEDVEGLPNGTYKNIIETRLLSVEELSTEIAFIGELLNLAIKNNIAEGSDISNLIYNADFTEDANFKGWVAKTTKTGNGSNFSCRTGFLDIYPVSASKNTSFYVYQDLEEEDLPNGIYELIVPAYQRTGDIGLGDFSGQELVASDIYINDFHTPVWNLYKCAIPYNEAINGVNCRFDPSGDPSAPHNGEETHSYDRETGTGWVPDGRYAMSFAFSAGRFVNHAFAIVDEGEALRIGIQNTGTPWYEGGVTAWGKFQLVYRGFDTEAIQSMMTNFEEHLENLRIAQEEQDFYISAEHLNRISSLIGDANAEENTQAKLELARQINDEFNTINASHAIYQGLSSLMEYCYNQGDAMLDSDPNLSDDLYAQGDEIQEHLLDCDLSDDDVEQYMTKIRDNTSIGGGFYVQGDLLDAEGEALAYGEAGKAYPLEKQADGTYTGTFKTQNRANQVHADARAGVYFTRFDQTFKSNQQYRRFVTPEYNNHPLIDGAGQDYQMIGAEMRVTLNPKDSTVVFDPIEYAWHDRVFVCGSIIDKDGKEHRWKNDEMAPLKHMGDGMYVGTVRFFEDYVYPGYATFLVMASRSTLDDEENSTVTRPGWLEASYTTALNDSILTPGETVGDLVRGWGNAHRLRIEWPAGVGPTDYIVTFDMNNRSICVKVDDGTDPDGIQTIEGTFGSKDGIYNLAGQKMSSGTLPKGIYIKNGKKVAIK